MLEILYFDCSVGGADYGSVRIGAFMGRTMIKSSASNLLPRSSSTTATATSEELEENGVGVELLETEASLDYLCNLSPHRYEAVYVNLLPHSILGEAFLQKFADHGDSVTVIDPKRNYGVKSAAKHPIYENFRVKVNFFDFG